MSESTSEPINKPSHVKAAAIKKTVKTMKNDPTLSARKAEAIFIVSSQSVLNHLNDKKKLYAPDYYVNRQRLLPIEEKILIRHYLRIHRSGFSLNILYLRGCVAYLCALKGDFESIEEN